ncbi:hypothetical protein KW797_01905, partial [Candidatus Parcubacteria bacterium]|nr:hypothetical protein [Candidatus Parcubacteria bacterium]
MFPGLFPTYVGYQKPPYGAPANHRHSYFQNLIGAWTFDESSGLILQDHSPLRNHGLIGAAPSKTATKYGGGLQMTTASTSRVTVPYNSRLNCLKGITISLRVISPSSFSNTFRSGVGKPFASTHTNPFFDWSVGFPFTDSTHIQVEFRIGGQVVDTGATTYGVSTPIHIIAVQQLSGDMAVHVNGVLNVATAAGVAFATNTNSQDIKFGINNGNSENFEGIYDHCFVWDAPFATADVPWLFQNPFSPLLLDDGVHR